MKQEIDNARELQEQRDSLTQKLQVSSNKIFILFCIESHQSFFHIVMTFFLQLRFEGFWSFFFSRASDSCLMVDFQKLLDSSQ